MLDLKYVAANFDSVIERLKARGGNLDLGPFQKLVSERREGTKRLYSVRSEGFEDLMAFLESFWGDGLERLKIAAEHEEGRRRRGRRPA